MNEKTLDFIKYHETICSVVLNDSEEKKALVMAAATIFSPLAVGKLKRSFRNDPDAVWTITISGPSGVVKVPVDSGASEIGTEKKKSVMR